MLQIDIHPMGLSQHSGVGRVFETVSTRSQFSIAWTKLRFQYNVGVTHTVTRVCFNRRKGIGHNVEVYFLCMAISAPVFSKVLTTGLCSWTLRLSIDGAAETWWPDWKEAVSHSFKDKKLSLFTTVWKESNSSHTGPLSQGHDTDIAPAGWT